MPAPSYLIAAALCGICLTSFAQTETEATVDTKAQRARGTLIDKVDTNKDGKASLKEIQAARPAYTAKQFNRWDKNNDGMLEKSELRKPAPAKPVVKKRAYAQSDESRYAARLVQEYGGDGDQKISLAELQTLKPGFPKSTFSALDRNNDGVLSAADVAKKPNTDTVGKKPKPAVKKGTEEKKAKKKRAVTAAEKDGSAGPDDEKAP